MGTKLEKIVRLSEDKCPTGIDDAIMGAVGRLTGQNPMMWDIMEHTWVHHYPDRVEYHFRNDPVVKVTKPFVEVLI